MILRLFAALLAAFTFFGPTESRAEMPIFSEQNGLAIGGYDVVAFFDEQHAMRGNSAHALMWKGVVWHFATAGNQARFEANPRAYAPVFGGYCAYAMARGYLAAGNPELWVIEDGELFLLNNSAAHGLWQQDATALNEIARENWPSVLRK
ncbi:twin-arginine translocation pathway signal sequence domain protein, putative [Roseobacter sp. SK209-2-6]|nr:twin-arginine translocation pathway signal sequence domain protein, putative [Roseobacter sp. SK209-2-6]